MRFLAVDTKIQAFVGLESPDTIYSTPQRGGAIFAL